MTDSIEKFAIIAYIAKATMEKGTLGKKALQKLMHLSHELRNVPVGYDFKLYTYGPFSRELAGDVDLLDSMGLISVQFDASRNGYEIKAVEKSQEILSKNEEFINSVKDDLDFIVERFGGRLAKELELSSMITFILKNRLTDVNDDQAIVNKFLEIKPHYHQSEISAGLSEIKELLN
jgi:uncharacterized protein YwgA